MNELTLVLFQRMGILLLIAFILTRFPMFRKLIDRQDRIQHILLSSIIFGLFGIAGHYAGLIVSGIHISSSFWIFSLEAKEVLAHAGLVGVVIGGLLSGPIVGVGAGLIAGFHMYMLGGDLALAMAISTPLTGLLAGYIARFFSQERVISPAKALFIGMFAPIIQMCFLFIFTRHPEWTIQMVDQIGIPMVLTNSISIAIFTTMIRIALKEEERAAALETKRALHLVELILPHLKQGLTSQTADTTAQLLKNELKVDGIAITDTEQILAHIGIGSDHHLTGEKIQTEISRKALQTGEVQIAYQKEHIQCEQPHCPISASIIVPFSQMGKVVGLIKLYYKRAEHISPIEEALVNGLGQLISNQLDVALAEKMTHLMKDAELRVLQAQINPHFLFNTLNSIVTLIRTDPALARHVTIQLGIYMRHNLKITSSALIPLHQEMTHLNAYLEIIKIRFSEQFSIHCECEPGLENVLIPPATFQPFIENSIQHGFKDRKAGGRISILVRHRRNQVEIRIEDNGLGVSNEYLFRLGEEPIQSKEGNGIGVYNVNQRLISLFGQSSRIHVFNKETGGCLITFTIPLEVSKEAV